MKDEEILKKAIEKAVEGGYERDVRNYPMHAVVDYPQLIIFSHDFAKTFWGEKALCHSGCPEGMTCNKCDYLMDASTPAWQYHLQQMVLEKEPLKYLEKFL